MDDTYKKPKSIEDIVKDAKDFDHTSQYPFRIAVRTAQNILNQVRWCVFVQQRHFTDGFARLSAMSEKVISSKHTSSSTDTPSSA